MDNLKQIEQERFGCLSNLPLPINKIRKKARNLANKIKSIDTKQVTHASCSKSESNLSMSLNSKWDLKEHNEEQPKKASKYYTCKTQNLYTIKNGEIVRISGGTASNLKEEEVKQISLEELKSMPKFQDYQEGTTSKVVKKQFIL